YDAYSKSIQFEKQKGVGYIFRGIFQKNRIDLDNALKDFEKASELLEKEGKKDFKIFSEDWINTLRKEIDERNKNEIPSEETAIIRRIKAKLQNDPEDDPLSKIRDREKQFTLYLERDRTIQPEDSFLIILRRWNSYTPKIPSEKTDTKGGGYFLVWKGKGIVIDPGFDFISNFDKAGFSLRDIDAILITHAHTDHTADFESLLSLKHEQKKHIQTGDCNIDLFMNIGSLNKFIGWISRLDVVNKVTILNRGDRVYPKDYSLYINVTAAKHSEIIGNDCIGLVLELINNNNNFKLGITSDTGYSTEIMKQYKGCKLLCLHLGSILSNEFNEALPLRGKKRLYPEHLGMIGVISMVKYIRPNISIITEFGEELGEDRDIYAKELDHKFEDGHRCFTGDINMKICLPDLGVKCAICNQYCIYSDINEISKDHGKEIVYVCRHHTQQETTTWLSP
ncbi:MBL fold metallo-hydrolase, partial [Chloroflexota bacterium]